MGSEGYLLVVQFSVLIALWKAAKLSPYVPRSRPTVKTFHVEGKAEGVSFPHRGGRTRRSSCSGLARTAPLRSPRGHDDFPRMMEWRTPEWVPPKQSFVLLWFCGARSPKSRSWIGWIPSWNSRAESFPSLGFWYLYLDSSHHSGFTWHLPSTTVPTHLCFLVKPILSSGATQLKVTPSP